jgi:hypothetical protein
MKDNRIKITEFTKEDKCRIIVGSEIISKFCNVYKLSINFDQAVALEVKSSGVSVRTKRCEEYAESKKGLGNYYLIQVDENKVKQFTDKLESGQYQTCYYALISPYSAELLVQDPVRLTSKSDIRNSIVNYLLEFCEDNEFLTDSESGKNMIWFISTETEEQELFKN